jgi:hypothetical protein
MGLLDVFNSDEGMLGLGLLAAAGPTATPASLGQRMAGAAQMYRTQKAEEEQRKLMQEYRQAQMQAMKGAAEDRAVARDIRLGEQAEKERARAEQRRREELIRSVFSPVTGAQAVSMSGGPTNDAANMVGQVPPMNPQTYQRLIAEGLPVDRVKALAESAVWGKPEVARTIETVDPQGRPVTVQYDKFGNRVGDGMLQWKAPVMVNQGDKTTAVDPVTLATRGAFGINMSPAERDASARGWASNALARERLTIDRQEKPPSGYRWAANGQLEAIPGGPAADKPVTDAQAKANLFGTRAAEANAVLDGLAKEGVTRQGSINAAASAVPFIGNQLSNLTNWTQSAPQQMVGQTQRDFINAVLRRESGAVISQDEFANAERQYFPQVGDSPETIALKRKNRETAVQGILAEVPDGKRLQIKPFSRIVKLEDGTSVSARLEADGGYYVTKNGKKYRVED